ncbi:hypothetical protein [uncultured Stenotrophomonas sp.]|uniref:hypothetical protein n=1 Tax=uncultured Stenotrophomonas sp. TaxID=165438 RepID=UPI0025EC1EA0|nr:hypothetical protein [uncultured Stenotrophomonas sp.]
MPLYRCLICGENFPGALLGKRSPVGFYATRFVEAASRDDAEALALDQLRNEDELNIPAELRSEDARVFFEEITEINADSERLPNSGFTFFVMGS